MSFLKKNEAIGILLILVFIFSASYVGYKAAKRRERDIKRMLDVGAIAKGLELYKKDYDTYPPSSDNGKIMACIGEGTDYGKDEKGRLLFSSSGKHIRINLVECEGGKDPLMDEIYLGVIPIDPQNDKGVTYMYFSNGQEYQILGSYEAKEQIDYSKEIKGRGVYCGTRICNFGKASKNTPLEKSLKEYENGYGD